MPFAGRGQPAPTGAPPPTQPTTQQPPPPAQPAAPPPPAQVAAPPPPNVQVYLNGNTTQAYPLSNCQTMDPGTQAWCEGMAVWGTLADVFAMHGAGQQAAAPVQQQTSQQPAYQQQQAGGGIDPYAGASEAQVGGARNPFLQPGDYVVMVTHSEFKQARSGNMQILEAQVLLSQETQPGVAPNPEGGTCSMIFKQNDSFLGNMKELAMAATGLNPQDSSNVIDQPTIGATLNGANPGIIGKLLYVEARAVTTRDGRPFTRMNFWPCGIKGHHPDGTPIPDEDSIPR